MNTANSATVRKTRTRKTSVSIDAAPVAKPDSLIKNLKTYEESFINLVNTINASKEEFSFLQKEIADVKDSWIKEQKDYETQVRERNEQEEITRTREKETYAYEISLLRKKAEDEFLEKKTKWERELIERKDEIAKEKQELETLRKQVAGIDEEMQKAVKEATAILQKQLTEQFAGEKKLREQEVKAEKDMLALRIATLTQENTRLSQETSALKRSVDEATRELKDVAVKVIESSNPPIKAPNSSV